jgi:hypothetical protein
VKVIATEKGYDGVMIREKGDTFDILAKAFDAAWMRAVEAGAVPAFLEEPKPKVSEVQAEAKPKVEEEPEDMPLIRRRGRPPKIR